MQLVSPFGLSKRPFIHTDQPFIVFFVQSFIFFIMNVEKEHFFLPSTHILIPGFWVPKKFLNNTSTPKSMYEPTPAVPAINVGEHTMGISFIFQLVASFSNFFRTHQMSRMFLNHRQKSGQQVWPLAANKSRVRRYTHFTGRDDQ